MRNILVAVDRTPASQRCIDFAIKHVWRKDDIIHLLHVIPVGTDNVIPLGIDASELMEVGAGVTEPSKEKQRQIDEDAKHYLLTNFVPKLEAAQVPYQVEVVRCSLDNSTIGSVVCKRAETLNAVAVVVAKHHKGAIMELFVGSVTKYCTRNCKKPLVVMHAD